jgi:hypothetical protein
MNHKEPTTAKAAFENCVENTLFVPGLHDARYSYSIIYPKIEKLELKDGILYSTAMTQLEVESVKLRTMVKVDDFAKVYHFDCKFFS